MLASVVASFSVPVILNGERVREVKSVAVEHLYLKLAAAGIPRCARKDRALRSYCWMLVSVFAGFCVTCCGVGSCERSHPPPRASTRATA
jgi:hypothetical protein